jgi:acetyl-CoA synthetase/medium-chain acyl-CoA synthetase
VDFYTGLVGFSRRVVKEFVAISEIRISFFRSGFTNIMPIMTTAQAPKIFNFASDVMDGWARRRPDGLGLWCVDPHSGAEQKLTFAELAGLSRKAANVFRASGLRRGDRVLVMLPRVSQWWIAMLGLIRMGAIPIPATLQLSARDLAYRFEAAQVRGVITHIESVAKSDSFDGIKISIGGAPRWVDFDSKLKMASADFRDEPTDRDEPGLLFFTSATTGEPKMVLHTQASCALGHRITGEVWLDCKPGDVVWNVSDLGWAKAAWSSLFGPWNMGACIFAVDNRGKFDAINTLDMLANYPISVWCAPPTALRFMVRQDLSRWKFPKLLHCVSAGEPLNAEVLKLWKAATGHEIYEGFGQTESVVLIGNFRSHGRPVRAGSMGHSTPGLTVALLDENLREVPPGQEGEVAVRVKPHRPLGLFQEYWKNPSETAAHFKGDWYLTGDRAIRDADGYHWFVGRRDDVIKSSGYRIGPFEVESVLLEHPAVMEVAVIGKPDHERGQIVKAFVVVRSEVNASDVLGRELQEHFKRTAAPYKYPREIEFVKEIPKTISGKMRRIDLRARAQ